MEVFPAVTFYLWFLDPTICLGFTGKSKNRGNEKKIVLQGSCMYTTYLSNIFLGK